MQLRRIVLSLEEHRRVVLYPEGGLDLECNVLGVGWVLDNGTYDEKELAALLRQVASLTAEVAAKHCPDEVAGLVSAAAEAEEICSQEELEEASRRYREQRGL
jgi:hypothetical protein